MLNGKVKPITTAAESQNIAVASTGVVYTKAFKMSFAEYFGLWIKAVSASGTPDIKVELEESYTLPATEGSSDGNWVEPDGFSDIASQINDEVAHIYTISPKPMPYGRFKITGINSNPADTIVTANLFMQEQDT